MATLTFDLKSTSGCPVKPWQGLAQTLRDMPSLSPSLGERPSCTLLPYCLEDREIRQLILRGHLLEQGGGVTKDRTGVVEHSEGQERVSRTPPTRK